MDDLEKLRHSAAHVMAEAVLELFPEAKLGIGPPIEDGFYYDFDLPRPLTPDDLAAIEAHMRAHIAAGERFEREVLSREEALRFFADNPYKLELIRDLPEGEEISIYRNGPFVDLCRGDHVASTREIPAIKLLSVAGAYWRGDEHRPMLQRIYGTAWASQAELDAHLERLEEARRRDHRKLGRELGLFYFNEDIGPGIPLFTPKGATLRHLMEEYVHKTQTRYGYQHVWTGHLVKESLFRRSGHLENYGDVMFPPMVDGEAVYRLKPMNCPSHMTLYNEMGVHSYRDLPLRFAEFATLYRYEISGTLSGLTRVLAVTQDDCHIFCTEDQTREEFGRCLRLIGSPERFLGLLIEHFAGAFPAWLAPVQAAIIPIADRHVAYAREVAAKLEGAGLRAEVDDSGNRMNQKVREAQLQKVPYMLVVGDRDVAAGAVSVRLRTEEQLGAMPLDDFLALVGPVIETRSLDLKEPRPAAPSRAA